MVWLVGNKGMLGSELERQLQDASIQYAASDMDVDITDYSAVESFVKEKDISWIINCAAYTAVDKAEDEEEKAYKINAAGPSNLAKCAKTINAAIIHISTDYVFAGNDPAPRKEEDPTGPVSAYGRTKLAGEEEIIRNTDAYFIIRTAWLYGVSGNNFVYTMLKLMKERDNITVVNDQIGSPTHAVDLALLIVEIIQKNCRDYGIYHFSNEGEISWYDFALEIKDLGIEYGMFEDTCKVEPCSSGQFKTKAVRPAYSLMSKERVKSVLYFNVPEWKESLRDFFEAIKEG